MRPKDYLLGAVILAAIVGLSAYLVLRKDDDKGSSSAKRAVATSVPPASTAPTPAAPPAAAPAATPAAAAASAASVPSCTGGRIASIARAGTRTFAAAPERIIDPAKTYTALMKTSKGDITISLAAKDAPITVNSFVFLACNGFYDGLTFHRVVKTPQPFVIQGGDPQGNGTGGPGYQFNNEVSANLKHDGPGVLAMANSGPNTNGSQFYITLAAQPALDGKYNVFGKVTDGQLVANQIVMGDKIESVSVREN